MCWICYALEHEDNPPQRWIRPCRCRGSSKWVHQSCLQHWLDESQRLDLNAPVACRMCGYQYVVEYPPPGERKIQTVLFPSLPKNEMTVHISHFRSSSDLINSSWSSGWCLFNLRLYRSFNRLSLLVRSDLWRIDSNASLRTRSRSHRHGAGWPRCPPSWFTCHPHMSCRPTHVRLAKLVSSVLAKLCLPPVGCTEITSSWWVFRWKYVIKCAKPHNVVLILCPCH